MFENKVPARKFAKTMVNLFDLKHDIRSNGPKLSGEDSSKGY